LTVVFARMNEATPARLISMPTAARIGAMVARVTGGSSKDGTAEDTSHMTRAASNITPTGGIFSSRACMVASGECVPIGPGDQHALKWKAEPEAQGRRIRIELGVKGHVDVCRENSNQQGDEPPGRQPRPLFEQQERPQPDLCDAADVHESLMPWQIGRHDAHVERRIEEMVCPGNHPKRAIDAARYLLCAGHTERRVSTSWNDTARDTRAATAQRGRLVRVIVATCMDYEGTALEIDHP
jgi:hypothetical protein